MFVTWFVARRFQEDTSNVLNDSPICCKENLRLFTTSNWTCQSIDIRLTFLQNKGIDTNMHVKQQKEVNFSKDKLWKLHKTIHSLKMISQDHGA